MRFVFFCFATLAATSTASDIVAVPDGSFDVVPGETGLLVKSDSHLAKTIDKIIHKSDEEDNGGVRGRRRATHKWDKEFIANVAAHGNLQDILGPADHEHSRRLQAQCFELEDGSIACVADDVPSPGLLTLFFDCPRSVTSVLQCAGCTVVAADSLATLGSNDPTCTSCTICSQRVAWDCRNLATGNCALSTCSGCAVGGSSPTPSPQSSPGGSPPTSGGIFPSPGGGPSTSSATTSSKRVVLFPITLLGLVASLAL